MHTCCTQIRVIRVITQIRVIRVIIYHIGQLYVHDIWRKCFEYTIGLMVTKPVGP